MGELSELTHKCLLPIRQKAVISHIVESFPAACRFVVALGHRARDVRDYLELAHPDRRFTFVEVDPYRGPGSGPGRSALACERAIDGPFHLVCTDTLWNEAIPETPAPARSWLGVARVPAGESAAYCNAEIRDGKISRLVDKKPVDGPQFAAFIGLAFVADPSAFFRGVAEGAARRGSDELQLADGFAELIRAGTLEAREVATWVDVGTLDRYRAAAAADGPGFQKSGELFFQVGERVIKFFQDPEIVRKRVDRAKRLGSLVPEVLEERENFYAYRYEPGSIFYLNGTPARFEQLLRWLDESLWRPVAVEPERFERECRDFYLGKTVRRLRQFEQLHGVADRASLIEGVAIPETGELLDRIDWNELARGRPTRFHGDLQFENILFRPDTGEFRLIDWRQDFGGAVGHGDQYYDLAKLLAGIDLNLNELRFGRYFFEQSGRIARFKLPEAPGAPELRAALFRYAWERGLSARRIRVLAALIYLNMAALHDKPLARLLHCFGRYRLAVELGLAAPVQVDGPMAA